MTTPNIDDIASLRNMSFSVGSIGVLQKMEKEYGLISGIFGNAPTRHKDFLGQANLLLYNRLNESVSVHQILPTSPSDLFEILGMTKAPNEKDLYREVAIIGQLFPFFMDRYQEKIKGCGLVDPSQIIDFSSASLRGSMSDLASLGYSRDHRPDRKQVTFGIATGINTVPTALTIQSGNTNDKKHMKKMLRIAPKITTERSLFMFDCGGNSPYVKDQIVGMNRNYLTLKAKKVGTYKKCISEFNSMEKQRIEVGEKEYLCAKFASQRKGEFLYMFFSKDLYEDQLRKKRDKFERMKKKGDKLLKKAKKHKAAQMIPSNEGWIAMYPELQRTLDDIQNPYINGLEGFFILESSIDADSEKILNIYKKRDVAEKLIRSMKEGGNLGPIRHWSTNAIIGTLFICFLVSSLINLTLKLCKNPLVKNFWLLKKYLKSLTLTVVHTRNMGRISIISNISPQILSIFEDFVRKYDERTMKMIGGLP